MHPPQLPPISNYQWVTDKWIHTSDHQWVTKYEKWGRVPMDFPEHTDTTLNWNEPSCKVKWRTWCLCEAPGLALPSPLAEPPLPPPPLPPPPLQQDSGLEWAPVVSGLWPAARMQSTVWKHTTVAGLRPWVGAGGFWSLTCSENAKHCVKTHYCSWTQSLRGRQEFLVFDLQREYKALGKKPCYCSGTQASGGRWWFLVFDLQRECKALGEKWQYRSRPQSPETLNHLL